MEALSLSNLMSSNRGSFPIRYRRIPVQMKILGMRIRSYRLITFSKKSDFQDFQGYARPLRLLPATETSGGSILEKIPTFGADESQSIYVVKLKTSSFSGSSLSDLNAGILLCLTDKNGDSILQRLPACSIVPPGQSKEISGPELLHFQRGSVDDFIFEGPKQEKIDALWIGIESGRWRLGGVSLTIFCSPQTPLEENNGYIGSKYNFEAEDILLGEEDVSMVELRPCLFTELSGVDPFTLLNADLPQSTLSSTHGTSNELSMREYADLKFSLLLYDAVLVFTGTSIASLSSGEKLALTFLTGGVCGFLYLLLLQRSVDDLPAPSSISMNREGEGLSQLIRRLKGPLSGIALASVFGLIAVKYGSGDVPVTLTSKELIVGMMGFLVCKVAVVLAAFKPLQHGLRETK